MKKEPVQLFRDNCRAEITAQGASADARRASLDWMRLTGATKYSFHFEWLGRPIIQYPQDIVAFQEIVYRVRPDVIVETGIAHGGSLVLSASHVSQLSSTASPPHSSAQSCTQSSLLVSSSQLSTTTVRS